MGEAIEQGCLLGYKESHLLPSVAEDLGGSEGGEEGDREGGGGGKWEIGKEK